MKNLNIVLEDEEHQRLLKKKGDGITWHDYLMSTLKDFDREEWKERVMARAKKEGIDNKEDLLDIAAEELSK